MEKKMIVIPRPMMMRASTAILSSTVSSSLFLEVLRVPARCRTALTRVLGAESFGSIGPIGGCRHLEEADLADLHTRIERDRQVGHVGQLQCDVPVPAGVDESGGRMDDQTQ